MFREQAAGAKPHHPRESWEEQGQPVSWSLQGTGTQVGVTVRGQEESQAGPSKPSWEKFRAVRGRTQHYNFLKAFQQMHM